MIEIYLESGAKRVFAGALDWPGWCRSARDAGGAVQAMIDYATRYRKAVGAAAKDLAVPKDTAALKIVDRLKGNATTDFGAPGIAPRIDARALLLAEPARQQRILAACWRAYDKAAVAAAGRTLQKGPRGGGRDLDAITTHVLEADKAYLSQLGGSFRKISGEDLASETERMRAEFLSTIASRARGEAPARVKRSGEFWSPRYAVRRSAWHALDHAWEIEDRAR